MTLKPTVYRHPTYGRVRFAKDQGASGISDRFVRVELLSRKGPHGGLATLTVGRSSLKVVEVNGIKC